MKPILLLRTLLSLSLTLAFQLPAQPTNASKRFEEIKARAESGSADAQCKLGTCYRTGEGVTQDVVEAIKWYRKAAEQGAAEAQSALGTSYALGVGVAQNLPESVQWYRKAAAQGYAKAQHNLGFCYFKGLGVTEDAAEAVQWFRKAAAQGYADSQYNLGLCYADGKGVAKDPGEAYKWFRKAAEQGYAMSQYNLGVCYAYGKGVGKDLVQAYKWVRIAALQNDKAILTPAVELLVDLGKQMTSEQIAEAQRLAREFKPSVGGSPVGSTAAEADMSSAAWGGAKVTAAELGETHRSSPKTSARPLGLASNQNASRNSSTAAIPGTAIDHRT